MQTVERLNVLTGLGPFISNTFSIHVHSLSEDNLENVTCQLTLRRKLHVTAKDKPHLPEQNA